MGMVLYLRRAAPEAIEAVGETEEQVSYFLFSQASDDDSLIDFDKAWDALNFMLVDGELDSASPLNLMFGEWAPFGHNATFDCPLGKVAPPDAVAKFNAALKTLTDEDLMSRYKPEAMVHAQIYLAEDFVEEGDEALEYIMQGVPALRRFAQLAADQQQAVAIVIQ